MGIDNLIEECIVGTKTIKELLRINNVIFIVDNVGNKKWVPKNETFNFWRDEVKNRIVEPKEADDGFRLEQYPKEYCYIARKCRNIMDIEDSTVYIILQMFH